MKLVIGGHEHPLTFYDACFIVGMILFVGGLWFAFGAGVFVALVGAGIAFIPLIRRLFCLEPLPKETGTPQ